MELIVDLDPYTRPSLDGPYDPPVASDPVRLRVLLSQLLDLGVTRLLAPSEPSLFDVLHALRARWTFEVIPLLVDAARQSRALQTYGFVGFARRRLIAAGPMGSARAGIGALPRLGSLARGDYVDGTLFLAALELSQFAPFRPTRAFLHANSSDPATANRNERLFRGFASLLARRGLEAGVVTNNAGWLVPLIDEWGLTFTVATPLMAGGYHMKPTPAEAIAALTQRPRRVIAVTSRAADLYAPRNGISVHEIVASPPDATAALAILDRDDGARY